MAVEFLINTIAYFSRREVRKYQHILIDKRSLPGAMVFRKFSDFL